MREARVPAGPGETAAFETDVLAGFVLARAAAGLSDKTISADVSNLEQVRAWFGKPLWEMRPADADEYFGKVMRAAAQNTRLKRAQALKIWLAFLELRRKAEVYQLTGYVAECPVDEVNRPRAGLAAAAAARLPEWDKALTPHVLRHFCASQLYLGGMDLLAIQEALGHAWVATAMGYVHVHATHVEDAWIAGQERAAMRLEGLAL